MCNFTRYFLRKKSKREIVHSLDDRSTKIIMWYIPFSRCTLNTNKFVSQTKTRGGKVSTWTLGWSREIWLNYEDEIAIYMEWTVGANYASPQNITTFSLRKRTAISNYLARALALSLSQLTQTHTLSLSLDQDNIGFV